MTQKKILAIAGSNSSKSINRKLMHFAMTYFSKASVTELDLRDYPLPVFGVDIEKQEEYLSISTRLREDIYQADGYLFAMPEHNRGMTAFSKNALDWASRVDKEFLIFRDKPSLLITTSPGKGGARSSAEMSTVVLTRLGAKLVGVHSFPSFGENTETNEAGVFVVKNGEYKVTLMEGVRALEGAVS